MLRRKRAADVVELAAAPAPSAKGKWTKAALEAQAEEKAACAGGRYVAREGETQRLKM